MARKRHRRCILMATLNDIDFEAGNGSEFSSTVGDNLSYTAAAAMAGTKYGFQIDISGVDSNYGVIGYTDSNTGIHRARFYFDINTLTMTNLDEFSVYYFRNST